MKNKLGYQSNSCGNNIDNSESQISITGFPILDGEVGEKYCKDLLETREYYKNILNNILNPLIVIGNNKRIKFQNIRSIELFGDTNNLPCHEAMPLICEKVKEKFCSFELLKEVDSHQIKLNIEEDGKKVSYKLNLSRLGNGDILLELINITDSVERERNLFLRANYDFLTNIPNRNFFMSQLNYRIENSNRRRESFVLLYVDLDGFKSINDIYGHQIGDLSLVEVAKRMNLCLRSGDLVARMGGDEFVVLLDSIENESDALKVSNKMNKCINEDFEVDGEKIKLRASIGIGCYEKGESAEDIIKKADYSMYNKKKGSI